MRILLQIAVILRVTLKRLRTQPGTTVASIGGIAVAVVMMQLVPLYADAVNFRILEEQLSTLGTKRRPPWSYLYTYIGDLHGDVDWETIQPAHDYLRNEAGRTLGLPLDFAVRHVETPTYRLFPTDQSDYSGEHSLGFASLATTTEIEAHIELVEGAWPAVPDDASEPIEVLVTQDFATEKGWQVGEQYVLLKVGRTEEEPSLIARIAGIWQPRDADEPYWFYGPANFDDLLLVPENTFSDILAPTLGEAVNFALWYLVMDGRDVGTEQIERLVAGAARVEQQVDVLLPEATSFISPTDNLRSYRRAVNELALPLFLINAPTIWMALAFIGLVAGLAVSQQRNEIAVMRSRGGTRLQVISMAIVEGVLLGLVAFGLGTIAALWLTQSLGQARSFLDFSGATDLRMNLTRQAINAGILAILLALIARIIPAIVASQHTIITYKQEQARSLSRPWWQRAWLDLFLVAIAGYGFYVLRQQGSLTLGNESATADVFQNPLLVLLPALTIFALTLFFLRVLPSIMQLAGRLIARSNSVSLLQAVRYLARTPRYYTIPLGLLVLTIGLAIFTASFARTIDLQLYDQSYYQVGADINLVTSPPSPLGFGRQTSADELLFTFLPASAYERISAIEHATRVGNYEVRSQINGRRVLGQFIGIDPAQFHKIAYWRWDFSRYRFGSLMNALGNHPNGVLVPDSLLESSTLRMGDPIRYVLSLGDSEVEFVSAIVGSFDYFPTWYPTEEELLIVGNLTNVFEVAGGEFLYHVWAESNGPVEAGAFRQALRDQQVFSASWDEARPLVTLVQGQPQRQGLFGLLSIGFIASALLTVFGFLLYALFSLQRRTVELGILRAVGLSRSRAIRLVAWELVLLVACGLLLGTALGVLVSQQYIPFLQVGADMSDLVAPPYLVEIAWGAVAQIYILFGLVFVVATVALSWRLMRTKLFESIKLGETI